MEAKGGIGINCSYLSVNDDESFSAIMTVYNTDGNGSKNSFVNFSKEGSVTGEKDLNNIFGNNEPNFYINDACADKEGNLYLCCDNYLAVLNQSGDVVFSTDTGNWIRNVICSDEGIASISTYSQRGNGLVLKPFDLKTKSFGEEISGIGDCNGMIFGKDNNLYLYTDLNAFKFNLDKKEKEPLWDWVDADVYETYNGELIANEDGTFTYLNQEYSEEGTRSEIIKLTPKKRSEVPQKKEIVLGCQYLNYDTKRAIADFNRSHDDIKVIPKPYNEIVDDWDEAQKRFDMDILAGDVFDIVNVDVYNYSNYAKKGIFEDLYPYFESSKDFSKDDFFGSVLSGAEYEGKLYALPVAIELQTMIGKKGVIKKNPTIMDYIELRKKYPDKAFFDGAAAMDVLNQMLYTSFDEFVDIEKGDCKFDTEEFYSLLDFAKTFPKEIDYDSFQMYEGIKKGDAFFANAYIGSFSDYQWIMDMFKQDAEVVGYPSNDGNGTRMVYSTMYGISNKSKNKDIAWEVISGLLQSVGSDYSSYEFPVLKSKYNDMIEKEMKPQTYKDENGVEHETPKMSMSFGDGDVYEYYYATQETVDEITELLNSAKVSAGYDETVFGIIAEETAPFFEGQKTKEEVSNIIQKRVKIYLQEKN
ncbi:MAG: extracellular solute-binding protein [Lachnospiraceae bacterium]|nr:extracellular solute-binding protein [Lachnospiraceae bacterium]